VCVGIITNVQIRTKNLKTWKKTYIIRNVYRRHQQYVRRWMRLTCWSLSPRKIENTCKCMYLCPKIYIRRALSNKKLISRWDSESELSVRRHRTRTTKYNRLVHRPKFRYRSTRRLCVERMFTKFSKITQCNGHYAVQGHSRSPNLVPIESSYTTSY